MLISEQDSEKKKFSAKGMSKRQNNITWQHFKAALNGSTDRAKNSGFGMVNGWMATSEQQKVGLSDCYEKCSVLPDGIHTEPMEFQMT